MEITFEQSIVIFFGVALVLGLVVSLMGFKLDLGGTIIAPQPNVTTSTSLATRSSGSVVEYPASTSSTSTATTETAAPTTTVPIITTTGSNGLAHCEYPNWKCPCNPADERTTYACSTSYESIYQQLYGSNSSEQLAGEINSVKATKCSEFSLLLNQNGAWIREHPVQARLGAVTRFTWNCQGTGSGTLSFTMQSTTVNDTLSLVALPDGIITVSCQALLPIYSSELDTLMAYANSVNRSLVVDMLGCFKEETVMR